MTTDEVIMKEMLDRATNPAQDTMDELGIQMFCMVVHSNVQLVQKAQEMILTKIRSANVTEATRAIVLLEECMAKCGAEFQDEIAKNRFLNNFIMLVLKKFDGDATPSAVKQRIMECLLLWTTEYPQKKKIRTVYDMLSKEGDVELCYMPAAVSTKSFPKRESILGKDEETLAKLLKSGDPEDLKCANLLIQNRVKQDSRRTDLMLRHKSELQEVQTTVKVLNDMLDAYETEGRDQMDEQSESMAVMRELLLACKRHKPIVKHLPDLIQKNDQDLMAETLETHDSLREVMERYKRTVVHPPTKESDTMVTSSSSNSSWGLAQISTVDSLSEMTQVSPLVAAAKAGGGDGVLFSAVVSAGDRPIKKSSAKKPTLVSNTLELDELREIFGEPMANTGAPAKITDSEMSALFECSDLLKPENIFDAVGQAGQNNGGDAEKMTEKPAFRQLPEIDKLSEQLFKQILPTIDQRVGSFKKESAEKLKTLNEIMKDKTTTTLESPIANVNSAASKSALILSPSSVDSFDLLASTKPDAESDEPETSESQGDDDQMLTAEVANESSPKAVTQTSPSMTSLPMCHLSEISIDLDNLTPVNVNEQLFEDDDIKISLIFTSDRPSKNVSVIVFSVMNKSKMHLKDFHLDASVKKPSKVRLLAPSDNAMPPFKSFRPAPLINQVLLLLNPTGKPVDISCIVGYKIGDDPDPIKELIVAKNIE